MNTKVFHPASRAGVLKLVERAMQLPGFRKARVLITGAVEITANPDELELLEATWTADLALVLMNLARDPAKKGVIDITQQGTTPRACVEYVLHRLTAGQRVPCIFAPADGFVAEAFGCTKDPDMLIGLPMVYVPNIGSCSDPYLAVVVSTTPYLEEATHGYIIHLKPFLLEKAS